MSTTTTAAEAAGRELTDFGGELIVPGDAGYDEARAVYNAMIDRSPALIARCADVADVIAAVNFAREQRPRRSPSAVAGTTGRARHVDDGLVIDLSPMNGVRRRPGSADRARRGRLHLGRRGPRHPRVRPGDAERDHLHHRRRRPDAGRRHRPSDAARCGLSIDNLLGGRRGAGRRQRS